MASPALARLIVTRLGAAGILAVLQGSADGILPLIGNHRVLVCEEDYPAARELLESIEENQPDALSSQHLTLESATSPKRSGLVWVILTGVVVLCLVLYLHMA